MAVVESCGFSKEAAAIVDEHDGFVQSDAGLAGEVAWFQFQLVTIIARTTWKGGLRAAR